MTKLVKAEALYSFARLIEVDGHINLDPDPFAFLHFRPHYLDVRGGENARIDRCRIQVVSFRVTGKAPELWHAETGKTEPVSFKIANGRTTLPLKLEPWGTVFVLFRKATHETSRTLPSQAETQLAAFEGPWNVSFEENRGAPRSITMDQLKSWSESQDVGVKYFSGNGTYTKTINVEADWLKAGAHIWIDLGDVRNLAEVTVNGKPLGTVWHAPYRVDVTSALKPGANELSIKVTNAWVNRLIGDQQPEATTKYTFTTVKPYKANSPLLPSGLLGPVSCYSISEK